MEPTTVLNPEEFVIESSQAPEVIEELFKEQGYKVTFAEGGEASMKEDKPEKPGVNESDSGAKQTEAAEDDVPEEDAEEEPAAKPLSRRAKAKAESDARIKELEEEVARLKGAGGDNGAGNKVDPTPALERPVRPEGDPEPTMADFADADDVVEAFTKAHSKWTRDQGAIDRQYERDVEKYESDVKQAERDAVSAEERKWNETAKNKFEDWEEKLNQPAVAREFNQSIALIAAIKGSGDSGIDLAYELAKPEHRKELQAIVAATKSMRGEVTPEQFGKAVSIAERMLGRFEAKLEASSRDEATEEVDTDDEEDQDDVEETRHPAKAKPAATAQPQPAKAAGSKKPAPPKGLKGSIYSGKRSVTQLSEAELRSMDNDDFRRAIGA